MSKFNYIFYYRLVIFKCSSIVAHEMSKDYSLLSKTVYLFKIPTNESGIRQEFRHFCPSKADSLCSGDLVIYVFELLLIQESKILIINYTCLLFTYLLKLFKKILRFISLKRRNIFFQKIP